MSWIEHHSEAYCPLTGEALNIIWLLQDLVEASFDLFRYILLSDQLIPWELHPLVSFTSKMNIECTSGS